MARYRLYFFADADAGGHSALTSVIPLECDCDEEAVELAEDERAGRPAELWRPRRLVRTFARTMRRAS